MKGHKKMCDTCVHILNCRCSYVNVHEVAEVVKVLKQELHQNFALKPFLSDLRSLLGTLIWCMKPLSLSEALTLALRTKC